MAQIALLHAHRPKVPLNDAQLLASEGESRNGRQPPECEYRAAIGPLSFVKRNEFDRRQEPRMNGGIDWPVLEPGTRRVLAEEDQVGLS